MIVLGCTRLRQAKKNDVERVPYPVTTRPQSTMPPPPQPPAPILQRETEVQSTPLNNSPELLLSPQLLINAENSNNAKERQAPKSHEPKSHIAVDAQRRPESSLSSSPSPVSSRSTSKAKTPRQTKNGKVSNKLVQTDLDTTDDEELRDRIRGNETMPGRNIPSPRNELFV